MIINPKNLRLGNLLRDKLTGAILAVSELVKEYEGGSEMVSFYVVDRSMFPLPDGWQVEPIPLTPEILEKCGFSKKILTPEQQELYIAGPIYSLKSDSDEGFIFSQVETKEGKAWFLNDHSIAICQLFECVHQLQNLYFALTGDELTVEL